MGYFYENSTPERFQQFCQSLLTAHFPQLQCFPIGQPDGGRDGWDPETKTVLQVKFKRRDEDETADWMISALEKERPKIERLASRGARTYVMATNARGSAHLETGRIDRVQEWMDAHLPIPGTCFWRDEIDRRFDVAPAPLKLKYSEVLSLEDGIEVVLGAVLGTTQAKQQDALKAFIAKQFEDDRTVKFKQVSLSNELLDLFIDVPIGFSRTDFERSGRSRMSQLDLLANALTLSQRSLFIDREEDPRSVYIGSNAGLSRGEKMGTAELLLSAPAQDHLRLVVLEGAPGQGKSTLAQYVCQIHRARFLEKDEVLSRVDEKYKQTVFRVPIKIDLRDYAAFLGGTSPFTTASAPMKPLTLDVFIAQLIAHESGGIDFSPHDVLSILKQAPTLIFLDGLDEVADLSVREDLVASIGEALARWGEFEADVQIVVTTRPSVFGRAPGFSKFGFVTLNLHNIDLTRINDYASKWVEARSLEESEARDVRKILAEKLQLAHIRDLTRNPMQLTILLSLIHQIGHSLPDQRTDLYARYLDLFLTREADKSQRVREHRPVLIGFIQHLAWFLQTQAESSRSAGSISEPDLQIMARKYLRDGGHSEDIAQDLFGGGLERIFVLVERIEGLYEFEVQPLREYFCAQYLYSTAPVGTYRDAVLRGDRAQRFEALAANPLWLNVCRFYAGSCERGESGTLVLSLKEMIETGETAVSLHARKVGIALLQDWVFSNVKFIQDELITAIFDSHGTQLLVSDARASDGFRLDDECGSHTLRNLIFHHLKDWPVDTRTSALCAIVKANGGRGLQSEFCEGLSGVSGAARTSKLIRMFRSGAAESLSPQAAWDLITKDDPERVELTRRCSELLITEESLALRSQPLVDEYVSGVLDGFIIEGTHLDTRLGLFAGLFGVTANAYMIHRRLGTVAFSGERGEGRADFTPDGVKHVLAAVENIDLESPDRSLDLRYSPEIWDEIVEIARATFGESWATMALAIRTAGIRSASNSGHGAKELFDKHASLCHRARFARLRRDGTRWWLAQLADAADDLDRMFWSGLVIQWASAKNLFDLAPEICSIVDDLSEDQYFVMRNALHATARDREMRSDRKKLTPLNLRTFTPRAALLISLVQRAPIEELELSSRQSRTEPLKSFMREAKILTRVLELPAGRDLEVFLKWASEVNSIRRSGHIPPPDAVSHLHELRLTAEGARRVLEDPQSFPSELVSRAGARVQNGYRPVALAAVAAQQDWAFA